MSYVIATKICNACRIEKPAAEFYPRRRTCKPCYSAARSAHKRANRAAYRQIEKRYRHSRPGLHRAHYLMSRFGITLEQYEQMLVEQNGRCAICNRDEKANPMRAGKPQSFAVDHDHTTGAVRALLCSPCNAALGMLQDDPDLIRRAAAYLEAHR